MKQSFVLLVFVALLTACTNKPKQTENTPATSTTIEKVADIKDNIQCFSSVNNRDTVMLSLNINGQEVTGELTYNIYEKDLNRGSITGELHGDTLRAEYKFSSEGVESVREVAFLKKGDELIEGYGEVEEKDGKMVFKKGSRLNFSGATLRKVPCNN